MRLGHKKAKGTGTYCANPPPLPHHSQQFVESLGSFFFLTLASSDGVRGVSTYWVQSSPHETGSCSISISFCKPQRPRCDDHTQFTAVSTKPARTGFPSIYRATVKKYASPRTSKLLKRPCQRCPLLRGYDIYRRPRLALQRVA